MLGGLLILSISAKAPSPRAIELAVPGQFLIDATDLREAEGLSTKLHAEFGTAVKSRQSANSTVNFVEIVEQSSAGGWRNLNDLLADLEKVEGVETIQPDYYRYVAPVPKKQIGSGSSWHLAALELYRVHQLSKRGQSVTVAVIDDAVMIEHTGLRGRIWENPREIAGNGLDDDQNGYIDDVNGYNFGNDVADPSPRGTCLESGHGTHVAGIIGATENRSKGVEGIASNVKIMPLAIGVSDRGCSLTSSSLIQAIYYAIGNGAQIINMRLGGPVGAEIERKALEYAHRKGVLVIIAAGNDWLSNDKSDVPSGSTIQAVFKLHNGQVVHRGFAPAFPSSFGMSNPAIISVANLAQSRNEEEVLYTGSATWDKRAVRARIENGRLIYDLLEDFHQPIGSSYGEESVDLAAPGTQILSLVPGPNGSSGYRKMTGTSMASPVVAGAAALLWSNYPDASHLEIKSRLLNSAKSNPDLLRKIASSGQLNLLAAICHENDDRIAGCTNTTAPGKPISKPEPRPEERQLENASSPNDWLREGESSQRESGIGGVPWR